MLRNHKTLCGLAAWFLAAPAHSQWTATIATGARYASVAEYDTAGRRIIREDGWLPGLEAGVSYQAGSWTMFGSARSYRGELDYNGRLQSGQPFRSETETDLDRLQLGLSYRFAEVYRASTAFEYDRWKRNISGAPGIAGLQERAFSRRLVAGVQRPIALGTAGTLEAGAFVVVAEPERLKVGFSGELDQVSFKTDSAVGYRLSFAFRPHTSQNLEFGLELDRMKIGRSSAVPVTRNGSVAAFVSQPEHVRKNATVTVGYRF